MTAAESKKTDVLFLLAVWCFAALFVWISLKGNFPWERTPVFPKPPPPIRDVPETRNEPVRLPERMEKSPPRAERIDGTPNGNDSSPVSKPEAPVETDPAFVPGFGKPRDLDPEKIRDLIRKDRLSDREARFYEKK